MPAPIAAVGSGFMRAIAHLGAMARFSAASLATCRWLPRTGLRVVFQVLTRQIWFTALQAIPLIVIVAGMSSFLLLSQAVREAGRVGATELTGRLIVVAIIRELGPLITALLVSGRSGTAMAAELATNKVMGELKALEGMGIEPAHYLVLPRIGGAMISVLGLIIVFDLVSLTAGLMAATYNGMPATRYFDIVLASLSFRDTWLAAVKGLLFGLIIGTVSCFHGLTIRGAPTEVPVAASRAVVVSVLAIFLTSGVFVVMG